MYKSLLDYDLRNMYSSLVLLACLSFLVRLDASAEIMPTVLLNRYRVGQVDGNKISASDINSTFCSHVKYAPFNLFHDNLATSGLFLSDKAGIGLSQQFLTTFVSGTPEARSSEGGATTIVGSHDKVNNYLTVCTHDKADSVLDDNAHSRINWLTWSGKLAPYQNSASFAAEFKNVGMDGKRYACHRAAVGSILGEVRTSDPFLVSAGLCGNRFYSGNIAAWLNGIQQTLTEKYIEICIEIDIPQPDVSICVYGVAIESTPIERIGNAPIIEAESVEIDVAKSRCIERTFKQQYDIAPFVFVSPSYHKEFGKSNLAPIAWVQYSNERGFKACVDRFGPHTFDDDGSVASNLYLDYAVIPINDGISNKEQIPVRNAITITIEREPFGVVTSGIADNNLFGPKMCSFMKHAAGLYDMHCHADSFLENEDKLIMNFVLQHDSMGLDESVLLSVTRKIEETLAMLYWMVKRDSVPLDEKTEASLHVRWKYERFLENTDAFDTAKSILASELLIKERFKYDVGILVLIGITHEDNFEITAHQECIVSDFTSGNCSVPTCEPGVYNGTKLITREVLSTNTRTNLCPTDMNYTVSCNQSPCELDKVSDGTLSGAALKAEERGLKRKREEAIPLINFALKAEERGLKRKREEAIPLINFADDDSGSTNRAEGDNRQDTSVRHRLANFFRRTFKCW